MHTTAGVLVNQLKGLYKYGELRCAEFAAAIRTYRLC
jgi:hypothetical protein